MVEKLRELFDEGKVMPVCPEVLGGMPTPRTPCEIVDDSMIHQVFNRDGENRTKEFVSGAKQALAVAKAIGAKAAVLKERSPSCGSNYIYDGTFSGKVIQGQGMTARLFTMNGIEVFSEENFQELLDRIDEFI